MIQFISTIWKPHIYHGEKKSKDYFEGWFYKMVSSGGDAIIAVINGVYKSDDKKREHAFIQVLNGITHKANYIKYNIDAFAFNNKQFYTKIGDSRFSREKIELDISTKKIDLTGEVRFSQLTPWPVKLFSPGVMGYFSFFPFMQTNHGILSMDHSLKGSLSINGKEQSFDRGRGYIEKDWGSAFPSSYVWIQSNNFKKRGISFSGSIATIPFLGTTFRGFIIGLQIGKDLYRFTTYTGAKLRQVKISKENIRFEVEDRKYKLSVLVSRKDSAILYGPYDKKMIPKVSESLNSEVTVTLVNKRNGTTLFSGTGKYAGLDVNGNLDEIAS